MRYHILGLVLLATAAAPVAAQQNNNVERRVGKLEAEMRAVQRKVFPGGNVEPEIRPQVVAPQPTGVPATNALADLTARVDALEGQLRTLTGQAEENGNRLRQLEEAFARFRAEAEARLNPAPAPPSAAAPAAPTTDTEAAEDQPATEEPQASAAPAKAPVQQAAVVDKIEQDYLAGHKMWEGKDYAGAQKKLEALAKANPKHRRASWARNLAGRSYLDEGKPATAAKVLLANYQADPKGERAADSLFYLGQALVQLKKAPDACKVYDELQEVYGASMRDFLKQSLPKARAEAGCL